MRVHRYVLTPAVNGDDEHETVANDGGTTFDFSAQAVICETLMPAGVKVLGAALTTKGPVVYALVNEDMPEDVTHRFVLAGNGVDMPEDVIEADYVATLKPAPGSGTAHIFTIL
jgi:hypothetical protein